MGLQSVTVCGKHLFTWQIGPAEAAQLEQIVSQLAKSVDVSVEDAAFDGIDSLIEIGRLPGDDGAAQEMCAMYYLLSQSTEQADYPGTFLDYVGQYHFSFDVHKVGDALRLKVKTERIAQA